MWHDIKEIVALLGNLIFLGLIVAMAAVLVRNWSKTSHLNNFSERIVRVDGRLPYTMQITFIPEFPVFDATTPPSNVPGTFPGANTAQAA